MLLPRQNGVVAHEADANIPLAGRVSYVLVMLASLCLMVGCFAIRIKNLRLHSLKRLNVIRSLVLSIYVMGISFIIASAILGFGVGVGDLPKCKAAIILCLVFYVGGKVIMYVFLVERVHSIQQHQKTRREDPLFLGSLVVVLLGFGIIAIFSFVEPLYNISQIDGRCRIGLPLKITLPLLIYDIAANLSLTVIFFHLVRPYMRRGLPNFTPQWLKEWGATIQSIIGKRPVNPGPETNALDNRGLVERLAWKSLVAGVGVLCSTVANLSLLFYLRGFEQSWLCFMLCTIDITWGVLVVHWVTHDPTELEHRPLQRSYVDDRWPSSCPASPGPNKPIPLRINVAHTTTIESGLPNPDDKYIGSPSLFNSAGYSGHRSQGTETKSHESSRTAMKLHWNSVAGF